MVAILQFSTVLLALFIMPEITPYRVSNQNFDPYFPDELEPKESEKEFNHQARPILNDKDMNMKMDLENAFKDAKYRSEKRNGDLINFLLGLPKDMLYAGR